MKKILLLASATAASMAIAIPASALDTKTATFDVHATVSSACTIDATNVEFSTYNPTLATAHYGTGTLKIGCVKGSSPTVGLSAGNHGGATETDRAMQLTGGTDLLNYSLFQPTATTPNTACTQLETVAWGNTSSKFTPTGTTLLGSTYNICGKIAAGQDVPTGDYKDTVTATIEF